MAKPVLISIKFRDDEGGTGSVPIYVDSADLTTVANAITVANTIIPILFGTDQPSQMGVISAEVTFPLNLTAAQTAKPSAFIPADDSRKDAGATLSFRNTNTRAWPLYVPGIRGEFISGGKVVVVDGSQMDGFIDTIIAGISGMKVTDDNGIDLVSYREGNQSTRKG
jgi:hypothetical protein